MVLCWQARNRFSGDGNYPLAFIVSWNYDRWVSWWLITIITGNFWLNCGSRNITASELTLNYQLDYDGKCEDSRYRQRQNLSQPIMYCARRHSQPMFLLVYITRLSNRRKHDEWDGFLSPFDIWYWDVHCEKFINANERGGKNCNEAFFLWNWIYFPPQGKRFFLKLNQKIPMRNQLPTKSTVEYSF